MRPIPTLVSDHTREGTAVGGRTARGGILSKVRTRESPSPVYRKKKIATWLLVLFESVSLTQAMISQYPAWSVGRSNLPALDGKMWELAGDVLLDLEPHVGCLYTSPNTGDFSDW
ncbi:arabinosyltransferase C-terminal domain-containing protein, partial [Siccibacter turicensis]|uniref:arabinosyltransferase C-terminal domain-containing protein n=1 Tax=Siccibacter turicensis TaxID=357233 RepID=UPI0034D24890